MANAQQVEFLTPIGRLVQGSVWILNETDRDGNPLLTQDGKPKKQCFFALAIDKQNPEWPAFWALLAQVAQGGYPQFFNQQGQCVKQDFAWKISDGDGTDNDGKPNSAKTGWPGCWVVKFSSSFLPRCFEKGKYQQSQQLKNDQAVKTGFFVRVGGLMSANIGSKKPGLYLNADLVELNFEGEEILPANVRDASAALGAATGGQYVPAGAVPVGQMTRGVGGVASGPGAAMSSGPAVGGPGAAMGGPGSMGMPGTAVQGNAGFVAGAMQAAGVGGPGVAGGAFPFAAQQQQPQYAPTPKAAGYTMQQFLDNGFNIAQLLEQGFFIQTA
jgi:hypothetical protein